jgi:hypothetical protein
MNKFSSADILQLLIARYFEREFGPSVVSVGNAPKWDIKFSSGISMEVKCDTTAARTGNAAIEYWDTRRNKPSGILETEASWWLHCVPQGRGLRCFKVSTKRLSKLCFERGEIRNGGDFNASCMKLIDLDRLKEESDSDFLLENELLSYVLPTDQA